MKIQIQVQVSGPLLKGGIATVMPALCRDLRDTVAEQAYADVMTNLNANIKHPTPYYETQVTTQELGDAQVVHDRGIVYGPWLEGTSARNTLTRFKGYHSFERGMKTATAAVPKIAAVVVPRHLRQLGGA